MVTVLLPVFTTTSYTHNGLANFEGPPHDIMLRALLNLNPGLSPVTGKPNSHISQRGEKKEIIYYLFIVFITFLLARVPRMMTNKQIKM